MLLCSFWFSCMPFIVPGAFCILPGKWAVMSPLICCVHCYSSQRKYSFAGVLHFDFIIWSLNLQSPRVRVPCLCVVCVLAGRFHEACFFLRSEKQLFTHAGFYTRLALLTQVPISYIGDTKAQIPILRLTCSPCSTPPGSTGACINEVPFRFLVPVLIQLSCEFSQNIKREGREREKIKGEKEKKGEEES